MKTVIEGLPVERDDRKNEINKKKHGISFETAALVFADKERIEYYDRLHSDEEDRYIVLAWWRKSSMLYILIVRTQQG